MGTGKILFNFCSFFEENVGFDPSDQMVNVAKANAEKYKENHPAIKIEFQKTDIESFKS